MLSWWMEYGDRSDYVPKRSYRTEKDAVFISVREVHGWWNNSAVGLPNMNRLRACTGDHQGLCFITNPDSFKPLYGLKKLD